MPPRTLPIHARLVRLEDVDRGVKRWFQDVVQPRVGDPTGGSGTRRDVHVAFSAGERWVAAADRTGIRDKDGRLILPVIEVTRSGFNVQNEGLDTALGTNVPTMQVARLVSSKTSHLANADLSRPISQRRLRDGAVYEVWSVPFPITGIMQYSVAIRAEFQQHLNEIIEKISYNLEVVSVPSFLIELPIDSRARPLPTAPAGQGSTERAPADHQRFGQRVPLDTYYVVGYLDGSIQSQGNVKEFTDQERVLEAEFSFNVPVALQLDPEGERPAAQVERTAFHVELGEEECIVVDSMLELDAIFGPK